MTENKRQANDFDIHISRRIRSLRRSLGLTQQQLAELMGVTYQQAHKYEHNVNRIPAGRLGMLAAKLHIPVDYFYEGLEGMPEREPSEDQRWTQEVIRHLRAIENNRQREALRYLLRSLVEK